MLAVPLFNYRAAVFTYISYYKCNSEYNALNNKINYNYNYIM